MLEEKDIFEFHIPRWEELPDIDLYLDQVVTFIDKYLSSYIKSDSYNKEEKEDKEGRVVTKTMINNYVKQQIMEPPVKKKYNRTSIAYLFVICILKQAYSISDIDKLIKLAIKNKPIDKAYNSFCEALEHSIVNIFTKKDFGYNGSSESAYILFNVVQTFASKLYVERTFLNKDISSDEKKKDAEKQEKK